MRTKAPWWSSASRRSSKASSPSAPRLESPAAALPAVQGLLARGARARVRAHARDQGALQALRALLAARGPHARHDLREALDAHAHVLRGGHAPAWRRGDLSLYARLAARARRGGRGCPAGDLAHVRRDHGAHFRADHPRAL